MLHYFTRFILICFRKSILIKNSLLFITNRHTNSVLEIISDLKIILEKRWNPKDNALIFLKLWLFPAPAPNQNSNLKSLDMHGDMRHMGLRRWEMRIQTEICKHIVTAREDLRKYLPLFRNSIAASTVPEIRRRINCSFWIFSNLLRFWMAGFCI